LTSCCSPLFAFFHLFFVFHFPLLATRCCWLDFTSPIPILAAPLLPLAALSLPLAALPLPCCLKTIRPDLRLPAPAFTDHMAVNFDCFFCCQLFAKTAASALLQSFHIVLLALLSVLLL
jgi:hypothetical protein